MKRLDYGALIKEAWGLFWKEPALLAGSAFVIVLVNVCFEVLKRNLPDFLIPVSLASMLLGILLQCGYIKIALDVAGRSRTKLGNLFTQVNVFVSMLFAGFLYGLIIFGGTLLLVVPGIVWAWQFSLYQYLIVDRDLSSLEALKISSSMTKGYKWQLCCFSFILIGINILGLLCLGIGLLVTTPFSVVAGCLAFRHIEANALQTV